MTDTNTDIVARLRVRGGQVFGPAVPLEIEAASHIEAQATEIEGLRKERDEARHYLSIRDRQAKSSRAYWVRAAKAALAGDPRELRNRVALSEEGPVTITNGDTEHTFPAPDPDPFARAESAEAKVRELETVLQFYADPDSYVAIAFFGDRPCGDFIEDFDEVTDDFGFTVERPGKRARASLSPKGT